MIRRSVIACALFCCELACDVSTPVRFRPDGGPGACPIVLDGDRAPNVDNNCAHTRCNAGAIESGCAFAISLDTCEDSELRGIVKDDGRIELGPDGKNGVCTERPAATGAYFSVECERPDQTCRFDVYPRQLAPFIDAEPVTILSVAFQVPPGNDRYALAAPFSTLRGYIGDVARMDDGTLAVATFDGRFDGIDCTSTMPTRTFFYGLPQLTKVGEAVTPPCLVRMSSSPYSGGFVGVYGGDRPMLGQFSPDGSLIGAVAITSSVAGASRVVDLLVDPDREAVYVLWTSEEMSSGPTVVAVHALASLRPIAVSEPRAAMGTALAMTRDGELAVSSRTYGELDIYDRRNAQWLGDIDLNITNRGLSEQAGALALHSVSGVMVVATVGARPGMIIVDPDRVPFNTSALDYEGNGTAGAIAVYRPSVESMLVGLTDAPPLYRARVARFDPRAQRFLPGSVEIGRGAVSHLIEMKNNIDMVAVLPWSAELVRLTVE